MAINLHINFVHFYFLFSEEYLQTCFSLSKLFSMSVRLRLTLVFSASAPFVILQPAPYHKTCHSFLSHPFQSHFLLSYPVCSPSMAHPAVEAVQSGAVSTAVAQMLGL